MRPTDVHHDVPVPEGDDGDGRGDTGGQAAPPWASTGVATDVPALDDVLGGPPAAGPTAGRGATERGRRAAGAGREAADRVVHRAAGLGRRGVGLARTRPGGRFARRSSLLVAAAVALVAGLGAGAGFDAVGGPQGGRPDADATLLTTAPETCAAAQVAWSRAAAAQVQMNPESPKSLQTGFVTARDALTGLTPPSEVAADWDTVTTYVTTVAEAAEEAEGSEVEPAVAGAMADLDTAAMTAASERITAHLAADCTSYGD